MHVDRVFKLSLMIDGKKKKIKYSFQIYFRHFRRPPEVE